MIKEWEISKSEPFIHLVWPHNTAPAIFHTELPNQNQRTCCKSVGANTRIQQKLWSSTPYTPARENQSNLSKHDLNTLLRKNLAPIAVHCSALTVSSSLPQKSKTSVSFGSIRDTVPTRVQQGDPSMVSWASLIS